LSRLAEGHRATARLGLGDGEHGCIFHPPRRNGPPIQHLLNTDPLATRFFAIQAGHEY
jgi:hypothetical protein